MKIFAAWLSCALAAVLLILAGTFLLLEARWAPREALSPDDAFLRGDIGLEIAPLKYLLVMDDPRLGGAVFSPGEADTSPGAWVRTFGFIPRLDVSADEPACVENGLDALPVGFSLSRKLPGSGSPFPIAFGGLACAACHSAEYMSGKRQRIIPGAGNPRLDIIAFGEAFKNAVQNPNVTAQGIQDVYEERCGRSNGFFSGPMRLFERLFLKFWLHGVRKELTESAAKYDLAPPPNQLRDSSALPAGPSRTRAFRSVLREAMDLPGEGNYAFSKIPPTFLQGSKSCGQYDGSICDHVVRSLIAAYSSGGTITELAQPDVVRNIVQAASFTQELLPAALGASFTKLFPDQAPGRNEASERAVERGHKIYQQHCERCHGRPEEDGAWAFPEDRPIRPITLLAELKTDPLRLDFTHAASLPDAIWLAFPLPPGEGRDAQRARLATRIDAAGNADYGDEAGLWTKLSARFEAAARRHPLGHPLAFPDQTLLYDEDPAGRGYQNNALPALFLHAPYLHNASVPNLAQLLNIERRPNRFCRGQESYDPAVAGYRSPEPGPAGCPAEAPWLFDASRPGNSNKGHDYPWRFEEAQRTENRAALQDLLEYLKTF